MTKRKDPPPLTNPETEVTREDIALISGASLAKVHFVTHRKKWGFPETVRKGYQGKNIYALDAVNAWLKNNDLKSMKFYKEDRAPLKDHQQTEKSMSALAAQLKVGQSPRSFERHGKTITVHVQELNEYVKPHSGLTKFSNSSAEHRSHYLSAL